MENANRQPSPQKKKLSLGIKIALGVIVLLFLLLVISSLRKSGQKSIANNPADVAEVKSQVNADLTYDIVNADPDKYKGKAVQWGAKIFTQPEKDSNSVSFQAYAGGEDRNFAVVYGGTNLDIKEDDYVIVTGQLLGKFNGENAFGAKLEIPAVEATTIEKATRNDVVAPTTNAIETNQSDIQNKFTVTLEKIELAKNETRFLIKLKNDGNEKVSFYNYDAKLTQGSKQYEPERSSDYDKELPSDILSGIEAEGYVVFPAIDQSQKQMTLFLDEPSSDNYDLDWKAVKFDINLP